MSRLALVFHPRVQDQLDQAYLWWAQHRSAEQAGRWYRGIEEAIKGLVDKPSRHSIAAESKSFPYEVRQLLFGVGRRPTHRVLFTISTNSVYVISVRHVAQDEVDPRNA